MESGFKVIYKSAVENRATAALLRLLTNGTDDNDIGDKISVLSIQEQSRKEKGQLHYRCKDCNVTKVIFEPRPKLTAKDHDVGP